MLVVGGVLGLRDGVGLRKTKAHLSSKHFRIPLGVLDNIVCSLLFSYGLLLKVKEAQTMFCPCTFQSWDIFPLHACFYAPAK